MQVIYRYFAVKPIRAEHPIGTGTIVDYKPGEEIPGSDWGRAIDNLVELGKAARVAFNVEDDEVETVAVSVGVQPEKKPVGRPRKRP